MSNPCQMLSGLRNKIKYWIDKFQPGLITKDDLQHIHDEVRAVENMVCNVADQDVRCEALNEGDAKYVKYRGNVYKYMMREFGRDLYQKTRDGYDEIVEETFNHVNSCKTMECETCNKYIKAEVELEAKFPDATNIGAARKMLIKYEIID